jgi:hypothetical protein
MTHLKQETPVIVNPLARWKQVRYLLYTIHLMAEKVLNGQTKY